MSTETRLDLKKTINLPKTGFAQKANLAQSEPARLKKWAEMDLYRLIQQSRAGAEKFILHDGPPYANADIHLGPAMIVTVCRLSCMWIANSAPRSRTCRR